MTNPIDLPRIRWDGIATLFYFQDFRDIVVKQGFYFVPSPLQHTWSLSIEEQFYAIWPLVIIAIAAWRRTARSVLAVTVGLLRVRRGQRCSARCATLIRDGCTTDPSRARRHC